MPQSGVNPASWYSANHTINLGFCDGGHFIWHHYRISEHVYFNAVDYYVDRIPKEKIKSLLSKMGITAEELLRTKDPLYKELIPVEKSFSEDELVDLMEKHPDLIARPIVEKGEKAILARPAERILEILSIPTKNS